MKRRTFLSLAAASLATPAFGQQTLPDPAAWLKAGPMVGYSQMTETVVWLQTTKPCHVQIRFWKQGQLSAARLSEAVETTAAGDHIARFTISRLEFGSRYDYEIYLDGLRVERPYQTSFQTQPLWQWRTDPPNFAFAIGSCAYINDRVYDRPETPYGDKMHIFQSIAALKPDGMLWLGDNIYYREADFYSEAGMRYRYAHGRSLPEMQALLASTHHYAIWDDHDFGPNDSDRTYAMRDRSLGIFKDYWANPTYGTSETPGVFGVFQWGDIDFFLLDNRYYRQPNNTPNAAARRMFGAAQMQWLMESLTSSQAPFKIIAGGNQMMNPITPYEAFGKFPSEQKALIDFIRDARIPGVVFLSGDRHLTELIQRKEPGMYPLYDFTSSPLTSGPSKPREDEIANPSRIPNTLVQGTRNFGILEFTGPRTQRKLTMRTHDDTGRELWRHEIEAQELGWKAAK